MLIGCYAVYLLGERQLQEKSPEELSGNVFTGAQQGGQTFSGVSNGFLRSLEVLPQEFYGRECFWETILPFVYICHFKFIAYFLLVMHHCIFSMFRFVIHRHGSC